MKVLFIGTHGQDNLGDELLLKTFVENLDDVVDVWYVNSYQPDKTKMFLNRDNVKVFHTSNDKLTLLICLLKCDLVLFGGGSIIKELFSGYGSDAYATLRIIDKLTLAGRLFRKKIVMSNIGVGPLDTSIGIKLAKKILSRIYLVTVRDHISFDLALNITNHSIVRKEVDAVFANSKDNLTTSDHENENKVGINICRNIANTNNWEFYINTLASNISDIHSKHKFSFIGIPMQIDTENNDDYKALMQLKQKVHDINPDIEFNILQLRSVEEVADSIDSCTFMIGSRLHSLIISTILKTPFIALDYDPKVTALMEDMSWQNLSIDVNIAFPNKRIFLIAENLIDNYDLYVEKLSNEANMLNAKANESFESLKAAIRSK